MKPLVSPKTLVKSRATLSIPADMVIETFPSDLIAPLAR